MTDAPNPVTAADWRDWAKEFLRYLDNEEGRTGVIAAAPVLLQHMDATVLARATTDGMMMFDPTTGAPVVSVGGVWMKVVLTP